jgi:hypothetical protein
MQSQSVVARHATGDLDHGHVAAASAVRYAMPTGAESDRRAVHKRPRVRARCELEFAEHRGRDVGKPIVPLRTNYALTDVNEACALLEKRSWSRLGAATTLR